MGTWSSGQEHRVRLGLDGLLLVVVIGEGQLVIPVDFAGRRPDPGGPGAPCRDKLTWLQVRLARPWAALPRRCRRLPPPLVVADSWCGDSQLLAHVARQHHGPMLVEGTSTSVFDVRDGRRVTGRELGRRAAGPWRDSPQVPRVRYVRLTATSPTYGPVTVVLVDEPGHDRYDLFCRATPLTAPRLIRAWKRRSWIEHDFRLLKHLLAAEACQVQREDADYGHVVVRLLAALVLLDTARILCKGRVTMEESLFSLKHHWRFLTSKDLELHGRSWPLNLEAA